MCSEKAKPIYLAHFLLNLKSRDPECDSHMNAEFMKECFEFAFQKNKRYTKVLVRNEEEFKTCSGKKKDTETTVCIDY